IRQHPQLSKHLFVWNDLSDRELEYCYMNARSLAFPCYVEGFCLPLVQAMQRGLPAMARDIRVFREIAGDALAYLGLSDPSTLANLVKQFESTGSFPAKGDLAKWKWLSWKDSAGQFTSRVQRNIQPVAPGGSGARRA